MDQSKTKKIQLNIQNIHQNQEVDNSYLSNRQNQSSNRFLQGNSDLSTVLKKSNQTQKINPKDLDYLNDLQPDYQFKETSYYQQNSKPSKDQFYDMVSKQQSVNINIDNISQDDGLDKQSNFNKEFNQNNTLTSPLKVSQNNPKNTLGVRNKSSKALSYFFPQNTSGTNINCKHLTDKQKILMKRKKIHFKFTEILLIFQYVFNFTQILSARVKDKIAIKKLSENQILIINDKSMIPAFLEKGINSNSNSIRNLKKEKLPICQISCGFLIKFVQIIPIVQPNQTFKILSDCWNSYWVVFRMFFTSIKLFFFVQSMDLIKQSLDIIEPSTLLIINVSIVFDMFLSLHTGYYENGGIVLDRAKVAKRYIKGTFIYDVLANLPLIMQYFISQESDNTTILIQFILENFIFFKWFSLKTTFDRIERVVTENEKIQHWWPLVRLIVNIVIMAHSVGLLYYGIAVMQQEFWNENKTWLDNVYIQGLNIGDDDQWFYRYLVCMYWAFGTMVSNIVFYPETKTEFLFSIVMIMMMTGIFGYVLNTIGMILTDIEQQSSKFKTEKQMINRFMKNRQIPLDLRERVALYIDYIQSQEKQRNQEEEEKVLKRMPEQLRKEILQQINKNNIQKFNSIDKNFSDSVQKETLLIIEQQQFSQGDFINLFSEGQQNQENDNFLYYIDKGQIQIFLQDNQEAKKFNLKVLKEGSLFGDYYFFTGEKPKILAKSISSGSLLKISRNQFQEIVSKYSNDLQAFKMIKDILINHNVDFGQIKQLYDVESQNINCSQQNNENQNNNKIGTHSKVITTNNCIKSQKMSYSGQKTYVNNNNNNDNNFNQYIQDKTSFRQSLKESFGKVNINVDQILQCPLCSDNSQHYFQNCNKVQLRINKKDLIYEYRYYDVQLKRQPFVRFHNYKNQSYDALIDIQQIQEEAKELWFTEDQDLLENLQQYAFLYDDQDQFNRRKLLNDALDDVLSDGSMLDSCAIIVQSDEDNQKKQYYRKKTVKQGQLEQLKNQNHLRKQSIFVKQLNNSNGKSSKNLNQNQILKKKNSLTVVNNSNQDLKQRRLSVYQIQEQAESIKNNTSSYLQKQIQNKTQFQEVVMSNSNTSIHSSHKMNRNITQLKRNSYRSSKQTLDKKTSPQEQYLLGKQLQDKEYEDDKKKIIDLIGFDKLYIWNNYFPQYNYDVISQEFKQDKEEVIEKLTSSESDDKYSVLKKSQLFNFKNQQNQQNNQNGNNSSLNKNSLQLKNGNNMDNSLSIDILSPNGEIKKKGFKNRLTGSISNQDKTPVSNQHLNQVDNKHNHNHNNNNQNNTHQSNNKNKSTNNVIQNKNNHNKNNSHINFSSQIQIMNIQQQQQPQKSQFQKLQQNQN